MNDNQHMTLKLNKYQASKDTIITCTVDIYNSSSTEVYKDFILSYTLPDQLTSIPNSVVINGETIEGLDIITGIYIRDIPSLASVQVKFNLKVINDLTATLILQMQGDFFVYIDDEGWIKRQLFTNEEVLSVLRVKLESVQDVMRKKNDTGELITYTIQIRNVGDIPIYHLIFRDTVPQKSNFVIDSFKIDSNKINGVDLTKGIFIGELAPKEEKQLVYQIQDYGTKWIRNTQNSPIVSYMYQVGNHSLENAIESLQDIQEIMGEDIIPIVHYKQVKRSIKLEEDNLDVKSINQSTGTIEILQYEEIETPIRVKEGVERGYKLVIRGRINLMIDYTTISDENSTDTIQIQLPFTTFIQLPRDHSLNTQIRFKTEVLRSDVIEVDKKTLLVNTLNKIQLKIMKLS